MKKEENLKQYQELKETYPDLQIIPTESIPDSDWEKGFGSMMPEILKSMEDIMKDNRTGIIERGISRLNTVRADLISASLLFPATSVGRANVNSSIYQIEETIRLLLKYATPNF
jgi:hypothetical protein